MLMGFGRAKRSCSNGFSASDLMSFACRSSSRRWLRFHHRYASWRGIDVTGMARGPIRGDAFAEEPRFLHPTFDYETRIVTAQMGDLNLVSVYVPNGGKDFPAKMQFLREMEPYVTEIHASGGRVVLCGDINIARSERDVHPKERNPALVGQRPEEREVLGRIWAQGLVDVGRALDPDNENLFTWWAPWRNMRQRNIGWRLD